MLANLEILVLLGVSYNVVPAPLPQLSVAKESRSAAFLILKLLFFEYLSIRCFYGVVKRYFFPHHFFPQSTTFYSELLQNEI